MSIFNSLFKAATGTTLENAQRCKNMTVDELRNEYMRSSHSDRRWLKSLLYNKYKKLSTSEVKSRRSSATQDESVMINLILKNHR